MEKETQQIGTKIKTWRFKLGIVKRKLTKVYEEIEFQDHKTTRTTVEGTQGMACTTSDLRRPPTRGGQRGCQRVQEAGSRPAYYTSRVKEGGGYAVVRLLSPRAALPDAAVVRQHKGEGRRSTAWWRGTLLRIEGSASGIRRGRNRVGVCARLRVFGGWLTWEMEAG